MRRSVTSFGTLMQTSEKRIDRVFYGQTETRDGKGKRDRDLSRKKFL